MIIDPEAWFRSAVALGELDLPAPGSGHTVSRFDRLCDLGRMDLSVARLGEAHADALAILAEADRSPPTGHGGIGVWAAEGPGSRLDLEVHAGELHLRGSKRWCSGAGIVTHALVTASGRGDERWLVLLPLAISGVEVFDDGWSTDAFATTRTGRIEVDVVLPRDALIGDEGYYLGRAGFWYGGIGVAACWAGGAEGLIERLLPKWKDDPHAAVALGAARAACWTMRAGLTAAAHVVDGGTLREHPAGRHALALTVRHLVDQQATDVLRLVTRAAGPGPLAHDPVFARRVAELQLYLRQSHGDRDLEVLGRLLR